MANLNGFKTHASHVVAAIRLRPQKPHVVFLNETKTDEGDKDFKLEGYEIVCKLDRNKGAGGIAVFARTDIAARVTVVHESEHDERCWVAIHSTKGPYLACCWYRPPNSGEIDSIVRFREELITLRSEGVGTIVVGDINVHLKRWLYHSLRNSAEGELLRSYCNELGLRQLVREPTRDGSLLDLVLTDITELTCEVGPKVADHRYIVATANVDVPETAIVKRSVWNYNKADWEMLQDSINEEDWGFLQAMHPSEGAAKLTEVILEMAEQAIGKRTISEKKTTHPWLTERAVQAVAKRDTMAGTELEKDAVLECSRIMKEDREQYIAKMKQELLSLKQGSKQWWRKSQQLMGEEAKICSIPALKSNENVWILNAKGKADLLAKTFAEKNKLIEKEENRFASIRSSGELQWNLLVPTIENAEKVMENLKEESGTGPDSMPARI